MERRQLTYSGHVQGVGFRYTTKSIAEGFAVSGYVRNLPDGRVELIAEGTAAELEEFLKKLAEHMSSHIRSVDCDRRPALGEFADFTIRY